jgi:hypothetical protein
VLLCLFPALLLAWLRAPRRRLAVLAAAIADLGLGLGIGLYATHQLRPADATDVDLNPFHAIDNARKMRDQVNARTVSQEKQTEQILGERSTPKPKAAAPSAPSVPTVPSAPAEPMRKVITPRASPGAPEAPEETDSP